MEIKTEVLVVGGGATGAGIARDLALRGIPCVLLDKGGLAAGASGRNQGLLHSGARYAVTDPEAARECRAENRILRKIAAHCIEETGGLFVSLADDDLSFRDRFVGACEKAGIETEVLDAHGALGLEPGLNPDLVGAVKVPDAAVDPFGLVLANLADARDHGATCLLHTEVVSVARTPRGLGEVAARDLVSGEEHTIRPSWVVNATGPWASRFLHLCGLHGALGLALSKGAMLITNCRLSTRVINRCRLPSDGDIIVPNDTVSILGTTSVPVDDPGAFEVTEPEVSLIVRETSAMMPEIGEARFIRAYAGIRPLFQASREAPGAARAVSRGFAVIDHGADHGVGNLFSVVGGKLITYRLMAEQTADLLCAKMGLDIACSTHAKPLPAPRTGAWMEAAHGETICDCELVTRAEIEERLKEEPVRVFNDFLHRTRLAKGTCQGAFCSYRLMGILSEAASFRGDPTAVLKEFLEERWKGIRPVLWGAAVREEELIESIYKGIFNFGTSRDEADPGQACTTISSS